MYLAAGEYAELVEEPGMEDAVFGSKGKDAFYVTGCLVVEACGNVFVEEFVCTDVVTLSAVDAGEGAK